MRSSSVSTSTKLELLQATLAIRAQLGIWWYADLAAEGVPHRPAVAAT